MAEVTLIAGFAALFVAGLVTWYAMGTAGSSHPS